MISVNYDDWMAHCLRRWAAVIRYCEFSAGFDLNKQRDKREIAYLWKRSRKILMTAKVCFFWLNHKVDLDKVLINVILLKSKTGNFILTIWTLNYFCNFVWKKKNLFFIVPLSIAVTAKELSRMGWVYTYYCVCRLYQWEFLSDV